MNTVAQLSHRPRPAAQSVDGPMTVVNLNHGASIDTLASWEDPHYGGVSPPPRKKLKTTQGEEDLSSTVNMQHQTEVANGASQHQLNGSADGGAAVAVNGVRDETKKAALKLDPINKDMVRLIGQHLANLGFQNTVEQLMAESGCRLDHPEARKFKTCVLGGDWKGAESALLQLESMLNNPAHLTEMRFLILEQKYMELIERGDDIGALNCLRGEISPLEHNISRVHRLSSLIFYNNPAELKKATNWLGSGPDSHMALMERLSTYLPPSVMLPPRRLERLIIQSLQHQISKCEFHNTSIGPLCRSDNLESMSISEAVISGNCLLSDHQCGKDNFPSTCLHTINEHTDEVLIAAFSPNGRYLATAGKDFALIIWDVDCVKYRSHHLRC
ncbi:WD40-repeat-containing domain [Trinorchestia longiramus]|nr:WD40-repeat-containing domain [Trinorchestia longiramus]